MTWNPLEQPIDYVVLAGKRSPGVATLSGWADRRRWDERAGYGLSGATLVWRGAPLLRGKLVLELTTSDDFDAWDGFKALLARPPRVTTAPANQNADVLFRPYGPRPRTLSISHPQLEALGVRFVVVEELGQLEQVEDGKWSVEISLIEFRPPIHAISRPTAPAAAPQLDALDREIVALTGQVQQLAGEVPQS